jgi:uncharacterized protein (TIGR00369 family)
VVAGLHGGARAGGGAGLKPADEGFEERVRASFEKQRFMATIGARLVHVAAGEVDIELPIAEALGQQNGFVHAGVVAGATDSACGYAAATLLSPGDDVLTAEFKINLLAPAAGERLVARGRVLRAGRTLTVCRGEAFAVTGDEERIVATMLATMAPVRR